MLFRGQKKKKVALSTIKMAEDIRKRQNFSAENLERAAQLGKKQSGRKHPNWAWLNES